MRTDYLKEGCLFPYKLYPKHSGKREISLRNELSSNSNLTAHRGRVFKIGIKNETTF